METQSESPNELAVAARLATPSMRLLKSRYGFDTLAERKSCVEIARLTPNSRVLDVGTGSGWMAIVAACAGHHVVSVDVDREALLDAESRAKQCGDAVAARIEFKETSATNLPFEDSQFDAVFSFESIHHLRDCSAALAELWRVTRSNGPLVIVDLNERGMHAVRETFLALNGTSHEENECRLPAIEHMLSASGKVEQHHLAFVGVFIVRKTSPIPR